MLVAGLLTFVSINYKQLIPTRTIYSDCQDVFDKVGVNGVYEIMGEEFTQDQLWRESAPKFTFCQDGLTLIQKTDPKSGNHPYYFERSLEPYKKGFGETSREYWIGLDQMVFLNQKLFCTRQTQYSKHTLFQPRRRLLGVLMYEIGTPPCLVQVQAT